MTKDLKFAVPQLPASTTEGMLSPSYTPAADISPVASRIIVRVVKLGRASGEAKSKGKGRSSNVLSSVLMYCCLSEAPHLTCMFFRSYNIPAAGPASPLCHGAITFGLILTRGPSLCQF